VYTTFPTALFRWLLVLLPLCVVFPQNPSLRLSVPPLIVGCARARFDTAVEEAQRAINAAHVEAESVENGLGVVKLMGRYSGYIAMYATLASRDVDICLIPEIPFR
jgi:hypothetical protein